MEREQEGKKRLLLVINPCAGMRRVNRYLSDIVSIFMAAGYETLVCMTEKRGDGTAFVCRHARESDEIVAAGGDGTFNEVVTGIQLTGYQNPVGYIPCGSTNDFANSLKLPKNIRNAAHMAVEGEARFVDVGQFGERYFSYVASFGAFTKASYSTPQNVKNALGHVAYLLEGIKDLGSLKPHHLRFSTPQNVFEDDYIFGAVSNSTSLAGVLTLNPKVVDMNDGLLELLLIKSPKSAGELNECIRALTTQDYASPMISFCSTDRVHIEAPEDMNWTLDGEFEPGHAEVDVKNIKDALHLMMKLKN